MPWSGVISGKVGKMGASPREVRPPEAPIGPYRATVARGFVSGMLSGMAARGLDHSALLSCAGITSRQLSRRGGRVPLQAYAALYDAVVESCDDEGFALFSAPLPPGTFEFLCRGVVGARRLGDALGRAGRFLAIVLPDLEVSVVRDGQAARIVIAQGSSAPWGGRADPRRVFAHEWLLRLLHAVSCWLVARELGFDSVRFPYARPAHVADYALIYTEHSEFGGDALVASMRADLLDLPINRDEAALDEFLAAGPGRITTLYRRDRHTVARLRDLLMQTPGSLSLQQAARHLAVAPRTLHRRLQEESSSFRAVKDAVQRDVALSQLSRTGRPIAAIAAELGYAEPSAFFRAFVRWTGEAPTAYRKRFVSG